MFGKKTAENLDFAENGNVIRRNTEADFRVFQCKFTEKKHPWRSINLVML